MARRRRGVWGAVAAVTVLWVFSAVIPIAQYVEAATVPSGATTAQATVTGYTRTRIGSNRDNGVRGKIARVDVPARLGVPADATVYLDYRWDYPERGDRLTVYVEDGDLRTTSEGAWLALVFGAVMLVFWPVATAAYLRSRRRGEAA